MSGTLARLLVIGFALSYGCSVLRSLISRQQRRVRQQAREFRHEERATKATLKSHHTHARTRGTINEFLCSLLMS